LDLLQFSGRLKSLLTEIEPQVKLCAMKNTNDKSEGTKKMTQAELATRLGITETWLSLILTGKKLPSAKLLRAIEVESEGRYKARDILGLK
jgi:DNA-binding XRE family transcriptional regulator